MSRRVRIDPDTARLVEERLQWLVQEHGPRSTPASPTARESRAAPTEAAAQPSSDGPVAAVLAATSAFRRPHLVVVAVIVALGILVAGWAVLRARPVAVAVTSPSAAASTASGASTEAKPPGGAANATPSAPSVVVHVLGAVKKPGLVTLTAGSRVQDALDAAGGLTRKADPGELNLAQPVADGQQIVVGTKGKPSGEVRSGAGGGGGPPSSNGSGSDGSAGAGGQPVNLNTASQAELEELPGVGPVMAGKIISWRTEHGRFSRVEELQEIDGVGPKTYAKLAPLCQV